MLPEVSVIVGWVQPGTCGLLWQEVLDLGGSLILMVDIFEGKEVG